MTVDPFVLRGASLGAAWRADRGGAAGAVYHAVGGGPLPIASGLPVVVTLLDLAPWELPGRVPAHRWPAGSGSGCAAQLLRDAAAVIVGSEATARGRPAPAPRPPRTGSGSSRWRRGRRSRRPAAPGATDRAAAGAGLAERERLGLPGRYLVYSGRYDARQDLATLARGARSAGRAGRPGRPVPSDVPGRRGSSWSARRPDDRASLARAAARRGRRRGARLRPGACATPDRPRWCAAPGRSILPVVSEAAGLPAIEAIACGTPVVASAVGPLPGDRRRGRDPRRAARPGPAGRRR